MNHTHENLERVNNWISSAKEEGWCKSPYRKQLVELWEFLFGFNSISEPLIFGVLLFLVREAWGDPLANVQNERDTDCPICGWSVIVFGQYVSGGETELEALVDALELSKKS